MVGDPRKSKLGSSFTLNAKKPALPSISKNLFWCVDTVLNIKPPANTYVTSVEDAFSVRSLDYLNSACGGIEGVVLGLNSNAATGICGDTVDLARRRCSSGSNTYQDIPQKAFSHLMLEHLRDTFTLILVICAVFYIIGCVQLRGLKQGLHGIMVFFITFVPARFISMIYKSTETNNTCKQLEDLSKVTANIQSKVIRNGSLLRVPVSEIVVGDVVVLVTGDVVPADGLVLGGDDWFYVDESIWKGKGNIVRASRTQNPFLIVGSKVVNGYAGMLVISVGINTTWGNRIRLVTSNPDGFLVERVRIIKIAEFLDKISPAAFFLIGIMFIR
ncbi:unnamed protein product [Camellia sinensis]